MEMLAAIFFVIAIVLFVLAGFTFPRGNPPTVHLGWVGMAALAIGLWVQFT
jgi:small-conductance mechanosensitive channel